MRIDDLKRDQWNQGLLLAFSAMEGTTDYAGGLVARTVLSSEGIEVMSPGKCRIEFQDPPVSNILFGGDFFSFSGTSSKTRGAFVDTHHLLIEGPCKMMRNDEKIQFIQSEGKTLVGTSEKFQASLIGLKIDELVQERSRWLLQRKVPENVSSAAGRTLGRALSMMKGQVYSAEGSIRHRWTTPDRWPHKDMWLWDTAFHAIGWRHVDPALAMEMIEGMFDLQRADGFLTYRGTPAGPYFHLGDLVTQPPVLSHAVDLVYRVSGDKDWLERMYPKLTAYVEWDLLNRDTDGGGLVEWFIEDDITCRSGESGMDNSPRFDEARRLDAVDFNAFLARECEVLGEMANHLGRLEEAKTWMERYRTLCSLINEKCWSEKEAFYFDYDPEKNEKSSVLASSGFLPLFCGAASPEQAAALARHLSDPQMFATAVPVPSVAVCDTEHYAKDMWRGPMWVNINWLISQGLRRYGLNDLAETLEQKTVAEIERTCELFGTFFEYFDDRREVTPPRLLRKGVCTPELNPYRQVIHEFGWTTTLYVDFRLGRLSVEK